MEGKSKRQRPALDIQHSPKRLNSSTGIEVIGVDCLEHIFTDFELKDLLIVANVNHQFRRAASYVFIRKYTKKRIKIQRDGYVRVTSPNDYDMNGKQLVLTHLKTALQTLRSFGHNISDLYFEYPHSSLDVVRFRRFYGCIIYYMNRYCSNYIKNLEIMPISTGFGDICSKSFSKAETVKLHVESLDILSFNRIFPKVQRLSFHWYNSDVTRIAEHCPNLQHLEFRFHKAWDSVPSFFKVYHEMETIHFPNVEDFDYQDVQDIDSTTPHPKTIPFQFDNLKVLTLNHINGQFLNKYHNFIRQHESIEKIIFCHCTHVFDDLNNGFLSISKSIKTLTSLKEICMESCVHYNIYEVIKYMSNFETLKYFNFFCPKHCLNDFNSEGWEFKQLESPVSLSHLAPDLPYIRLTRKD